MIFLTEQGEQQLIDWLNTATEDCGDHHAWVSHAEAVAMDTPKGEDVVIHVFNPVTKTPETLRLSPDAFFTFPPEA